MSKQDKTIKQLLDSYPADSWTDWLFQIQNSLIDRHYTEGMNKAALSEFAGRMMALHYFFDQVSAKKE